MRSMNLAQETRALFTPAFDLQAHLSRSAEVRTFDLLAHVRKRQTINVLSTTCKLLRRPL
jgi:hypothetical protein